MNNYDFTQVLVGSSWDLYCICCQETNKTQNQKNPNTYIFHIALKLALC